MSTTSRFAALAVAAFAVTACEAGNLLDPPIDPGPPDVGGVTISAPSTNVGTGATLQLTATVTPTGANPAVTWSSGDTTRLTVSTTGLVTAPLAPLTSGSVTITAASVEDPGITADIDLNIVCGPLTGVTNGGTLPQNTCYVVQSALSVTDGTLVIEEGVSISFETDRSLSIGTNGRLTAIGTDTSGITFTSADPAGKWRGLRFNDSQSVDNILHYVTIENGGSDGWSGAVQSASALLLEGNSLVDIQQSTIRGSASRGITLYGDAEMTFVENTLVDNEQPAWMHPNTVHFLDTASSWTGNVEDVVRVGYGNNDRVSTAQSWADLGIPYELQERMFIEEVLTIDPGVDVTARATVGLIVTGGGAITAIGTDLEPITFRGVEDLPGAWWGFKIETQSAANIFDHVVFANGGSDAWTGGNESRANVFLAGNSKVVFTNTTFRDSEHYGLYVPSGGDISGFDLNTFENNARPMIVHPNRAGDVASNTVFVGNDEQSVRVTFGNNDRVLAAQTWSRLDVPYRVMVRTFIEGALTIEAGTEVEFAQSAHLIVTNGGSFTAVGDSQNRIHFRGAEPIAGYWKGLEINTTDPDNRLEFVDLSHAGSDPWLSGGITGTLSLLSNGSVVLDSVIVRLSDGYAGVIRDGSSMTCTNVDDGGFQYYLWPPGSVSADCPT